MKSGMKIDYYLIVIGPKGNDKKYETSKEFRRHVYSHQHHPTKKFIKYLGDEKIVVQLPHGNSKSESKRAIHYTRTNPEVLLQIKERPGLPNVVFKKLVTEGPSDLSRHVVGVPRDDEQVRNVQRVVARSKRISPDALHNMVLLQEELGIIGFHDDLVEKFRSIIDREDLPPQSLTYDTTFNLGDFYLSVLVFPETE